MEKNNTWPGGKRRALSQGEHERWNSHEYPGTRQLCSVCANPTERCEDDTIWSDDGEPLCEKCKAEETNAKEDH
jgi:hypothetical protein